MAKLALLAALSLTGTSPADEAILPDGRRVEGWLERDASGRLQFLPAKSPPRLDLADLQAVRLGGTASLPWWHGALHVVMLRHEQRLTGELLALDDKILRLRTLLFGAVEVPRSAIVAVTQPSGLITVLHEDFEIDLKAWKLNGLSSPSERKPCLGKKSLPFDKPGQDAVLELPSPLDAGRIDLHFHVPSDAAGARWTCAAQFGIGNEARILTAVLAGEGKNYAIESTLPAAEARSAPRSPGWHRLSIRFHKNYALVGIDDSILWMSEKLSAVAPLQAIRFACTGLREQKEVRGEVFIDDLVISRTVHVPPRPVNDSGQDEIWLASGDQLFGQVVRADRQVLTLKHQAAEKSVPWSQARGIFLSEPFVTAMTTEGDHVRLWLPTGTGGGADQLDGVLLKLDDKHFVFKHRVLGEVTIDRNRAHQMRLLFRGRHIELDNGFHHLGDRSRRVPGLRPLRAEGPSLRLKFRLDAVPEAARLVLFASHLKGPSDGIAESLERGELRTELFLNEQRIDYLNKYVERASSEPRRLTVALPPAALRVGENILELRQTPEADTDHYDNCGIGRLAIEVPR